MSLSLAKGQPANLVGSTGSPVTRLSLGVGWDATSGDTKGLVGKFKKLKGVDLDLAALVYDNTKAGVRVCGFDSMNLYGGALTHSGDNRSGRGDGIDEAISVDLNRIPDNIHHIVFTLNAFKKGVSFTQVAGADCFLADASGSIEQPLSTFSVPIDNPNASTIFIAGVSRNGGGAWQVNLLNVMKNLDGSAKLLQGGKSYI